MEAVELEGLKVLRIWYATASRTNPNDRHEEIITHSPRETTGMAHHDQRGREPQETATGRYTRSEQIHPGREHTRGER